MRGGLLESGQFLIELERLHIAAEQNIDQKAQYIRNLLEGVVERIERLEDRVRWLENRQDND